MISLGQREKEKIQRWKKGTGYLGIQCWFFWCALPALYQCTKSCFCVLLQAFESVVLDTQRKVKNPKLQNRGSFLIHSGSLFVLKSVCLSPPLFSQAGLRFLSARPAPSFRHLFFAFLSAHLSSSGGLNKVPSNLIQPQSSQWRLARFLLTFGNSHTPSLMSHHASRHSRVSNSRST